eukprot:TRINITY_DN3698_c0_g1_i1.p1 TRINITY_DN3698_c0_g1~~TRINITY_DN3698_c0_g1_i1.p1  ORF type:complete len:450 (-),score=109.36 TRINITY_DN3698_c0_g1_i1:49-1398(-)
MSSIHLHAMFPQIPLIQCEEIFIQNNSNIEKAIDQCLEFVLKKKEQVKEKKIEIAIENSIVRQRQGNNVHVSDQNKFMTLDDIQAQKDNLRKRMKEFEDFKRRRREAMGNMNQTPVKVVDIVEDIDEDLLSEYDRIVNEEEDTNTHIINEVNAFKQAISENPANIDLSRCPVVNYEVIEIEQESSADIDLEIEIEETHVTKIVQICYYEKDLTVDVEETIEKMKHILDQCAFLSCREVEEIEISTEYEMQGQIAVFQGSNDLSLPVVLIDSVVADFQTLEEMFESSELESLIFSIKNLGSVYEKEVVLDPTPEEMGLLSYSLDRIIPYLKPSSWFGRGGGIESKELIPFDIIHTNQQGRLLNRRFSFGKEKYLRIDPSSTELRESYRYKHISRLVIPNPKTLIIHYNLDIHTDHISSSSLNISRMVSIIQNRCEKNNHKIEIDDGRKIR